MMTRCLVLALVCLLTPRTPVVAASHPAHELLLSGTDWRIREDAKGTGVDEKVFIADPKAPGWIASKVPGNIQADLEAAHQLKPLWYGVSDPELSKVAGKDWWYRKDFEVPAAYAGQRLTLVFDGVDQQGEVWLNGQRVGANAGMFKRFWFDVTAVAKPGQVNQLAVRISKCARHWFFDPANYGFKSGTNSGWDWGIPIVTIGIWKDVRLEATGPARIEWTQVQTSLEADHSKAEAFVSLEIDSIADLPACKTRLEVSGQGNPVSVTVDTPLRKGRNLVQGSVPLQKPALWWPSGQGSQPLYQLNAQIEADPGGVASDRRHVRFGVREIHWDYTEGAPADFVSRYQLVINGRPVRTMGSCLVPADLLFGRMEERALFRLRQAKAAGMNTLRLWGGGVPFHDSFYDLADELGILLSFEFPLANLDPGLSAEYQELIRLRKKPATRAEVTPEYLACLNDTFRNILKQVRNHCSIMEFCGGNEMKYGDYTGFEARKHPAFLAMQRLVAEEDGRLLRTKCPDEGANHGPWYFHLWSDYPVRDGGIFGISSQGKIQPTMRSGEFGSQSPANLEVWQRDVPSKDQWPILESPVLYTKKAPWWLTHREMIEEFGPLNSLPELVRAGQFHGAEGLRYAVDALRRNGRKTGGFTSWQLSEPWTNVCGNYQIDYDGRPLMSHDFMKQALAPVCLSLKYNSIFYSLEKGVQAAVYITSDAPESAKELRWKWVARDRRGTVFSRKEGVVSIEPMEVKCLDKLELMPPRQTCFGPVLVELRLEDSAGKLVGERLHVFGLAQAPSPFGDILNNRNADADDDPAQIDREARPNNAANLISGLRGKGQKTAAYPDKEGWALLAINNGKYGDSWSDASFQTKLRSKATLGRFKFGRDRLGLSEDRPVDYLKIETSLDGEHWQNVFERDKLTQLKGFSPFSDVEIQVPPVVAQHLRVSFVSPNADPAGPLPIVDELEVYPPAATLPSSLPMVTVVKKPDPRRPARRTTLEVAALPARWEGENEVLELNVRNTGEMTAFFGEVHPMIRYRTDLFVENNHFFIPPGESRTIAIRSRSAEGLSLSQTGWWISCWNADRVDVAPSAEVLLSVGRRDRMCREFLNGAGVGKDAARASITVKGTRPEPSRVPCILEGGASVRFEFPASSEAVKFPARLRIHTADQSKEVRAAVALTVNGKALEQTLPEGLGVQKTDPGHLAYPATLEFPIAEGSLKAGTNVVEVKVAGPGWFTWDSLECVTTPSTSFSSQ